jgi:hypothetical protein
LKCNDNDIDVDPLPTCIGGGGDDDEPLSTIGSGAMMS